VQYYAKIERVCRVCKLQTNLYRVGDLIVNYKFHFNRHVRTPTSEVYTIWHGEKRVGQFHIHYAQDTVHTSIILETDILVSEEEDLLQQIDDEIVSSYLPSFEREGLLVTIFRGEEVNSFNYEPEDSDFDDFGNDFDIEDDEE